MNTMKFIFKYISSFGVLTNKGKKNLSIHIHTVITCLKQNFLFSFQF